MAWPGSSEPVSWGRSICGSPAGLTWCVFHVTSLGSDEAAGPGRGGALLSFLMKSPVLQEAGTDFSRCGGLSVLRQQRWELGVSVASFQTSLRLRASPQVGVRETLPVNATDRLWWLFVQVTRSVRRREGHPYHKASLHGPPSCLLPAAP